MRQSLTREAAVDLKTKLPNDFDHVFPADHPNQDEFQVAIFYRKGSGLAPELPLIPAETEDVSRETRPMLVLHLTLPGHIVRFVACHWTGLDVESSRRARVRLAEVLRRNTYEFLYPESPATASKRHVAILGDLNEEPTAGVFTGYLEGCRDRRTSRDAHWRDGDVRRVRLYNLAWRYLGEQVPHRVGQSLVNGAAGTWYNQNHGWRTLDHVLVSGGLLAETPPSVDEAETRIVTLPILINDRGQPDPFRPGRSVGVSDHLPIVGRLILPETAK